MFFLILNLTLLLLLKLAYLSTPYYMPQFYIIASNPSTHHNTEFIIYSLFILE